MFLATKLTKFERSRRQTRNYQKQKKCEVTLIHFIQCSKFVEAENYSQKLLSMFYNVNFNYEESVTTTKKKLPCMENS